MANYGYYTGRHSSATLQVKQGGTTTTPNIDVKITVTSNEYPAKHTP